MEGGGGEEWNTRATGVQRRGIVTTWQSSLSLSLSLSLDTADFSTFRWTANLDNVFTESYVDLLLLPTRV